MYSNNHFITHAYVLGLAAAVLPPLSQGHRVHRPPRHTRTRPSSDNARAHTMRQTSMDASGMIVVWLCN